MLSTKEKLTARLVRGLSCNQIQKLINMKNKLRKPYRRLRRPCKECGGMFEPDGKFVTKCPDCIEKNKFGCVIKTKG